MGSASGLIRVAFRGQVRDQTFRDVPLGFPGFGSLNTSTSLVTDAEGKLQIGVDQTNEAHSFSFFDDVSIICSQQILKKVRRTLYP